MQLAEGHLRVAVVVDQVAHNGHIVDRGVEFAIQGVGGDPRAVEAPDGVEDIHLAAGVGAGIAQGVVLGDHMVHHGVAGVALAHIKAGIVRAAGVGMLDQAVTGIEGVDTVDIGVNGGDIRRPIACDPGPKDAVDIGIAHGQVLHGHPIGPGHKDAVVPLELAVDDHRVAVRAPDHQIGRADRDLLFVDAGLDQDQIPGVRRVHGGLDGGVVGRHVAGDPGPLARLALLDRGHLFHLGVAHDDRGRHPRALGRAVEAAKVGKDAGFVEDQGGLLLAQHDQVAKALRGGPSIVLFQGVVGGAAHVAEGYPCPHGHPQDRWLKDVVPHLHHKGVVLRLVRGASGHGQKGHDQQNKDPQTATRSRQPGSQP